MGLTGRYIGQMETFQNQGKWNYKVNRNQS